MSAAAKLAGFAAVLALVFGAALAAGSALGPEPDTDRTAAPTAGHGEEAGHGDEAGHTAAPEAAAAMVRGLGVAEGDLRLVLETPEIRRARAEELRFRVLDRSGDTVRAFDVEHTKRMHLILARRDLTGFQHLHPAQRADGSWSVRTRIPAAGSYRLFADFVRGGEARTLATDLRVDGDARLRPLPEPAPLADAGEGYAVRLDHDALRAGRAAELRFTVHAGGHTAHVQPYLGADGHLVALREGDLAFLHVHPAGHAAAGHDDSIGFEATFPTAGRYRLFLQFRHADRVRTAAFTVEVE